MNHLLRELAPLSDDAWEQVEDEAKSRLGTYLAGRRLVNFSGPHGWTYSSHNTGRSAAAEGPVPGVQARTRVVLPLVELRVQFTLSRAELDDASRGADIDLGALDEAAKSVALAENTAVFHGYRAAGIQGVTEAASAAPVQVSGPYDEYPRFVAIAVEKLHETGIGGPYGLALGNDTWTGVVETTEHGGYPLMEHLAKIINGPIVWAPGVQGGVVISQRGGDFQFDSGQDLSIGYLNHDADSVTLYLEESFTFRVIEPDAAVALQS